MRAIIPTDSGIRRGGGINAFEKRDRVDRRHQVVGRNECVSRPVLLLELWLVIYLRIRCILVRKSSPVSVSSLLTL